MSTPPDPAPVLDLLSGFRRSAVLFAAVNLGVFDRLERGPADLEVLAKDLSCDEDALGRLLDTCVGLGLLIPGPDYALTDVARTYLTRSSPRRMTGYILYSWRALWPMWGHLDDAVREGGNRWKQAFGLDGPLFSNFFRTDDDRREFLMGMHGFGQISSPHVAAAFDLSGFKQMVDLGGATGHLAVACCRRWPGLRATVSDLPAAVPLAREMVALEADVAGRIDVVENDFFTDPLPPGDLYAVGRILHDWGEGRIHALLAKVAAALPAGGALLIGEKLLDEDRAGPPWAQLQSLNMLVCAEGKERTLAEYEALLRPHGFTRVQAKQTAVPLDAVLAWK
ncbi:MAG: class I SAM-dependent methyltransferase [Gemmataceae bacterium]